MWKCQGVKINQSERVRLLAPQEALLVMMCNYLFFAIFTPPNCNFFLKRVAQVVVECWFQVEYILVWLQLGCFSQEWGRIATDGQIGCQLVHLFILPNMFITNYVHNMHYDVLHSRDMYAWIGNQDIIREFPLGRNIQQEVVVLMAELVQGSRGQLLSKFVGSCLSVFVVMSQLRVPRHLVLVWDDIASW